MITENHTKEGLSCAYIEAVAAHAGYNITVSRHDYGVDGQFHEVRLVDGKVIQIGFSLAFQAKATVNYQYNNGVIRYRMRESAYRRLIAHSEEPGSDPIILILFCMASDRDNWLSINTNELALQHCCYWYRVAQIDTIHTGTIPIEIPQNQILNVNSLTSLMNQVRTGVLE